MPVVVLELSLAHLCHVSSLGLLMLVVVAACCRIEDRQLAHVNVSFHRR